MDYFIPYRGGHSIFLWNMGDDLVLGLIIISVPGFFFCSCYVSAEARSEVTIFVSNRRIDCDLLKQITSQFMFCVQKW